MASAEFFPFFFISLVIGVFEKREKMKRQQLLVCVRPIL